MMLLERQQLYTSEEFFEIASLPENETRRLELDEGAIVEMAGSTQENTVAAARIAYYLNAFIIPRNLGYVSGADGAYQLGERKVRLPDVGYISKIRLPQFGGKLFPIAPDLAVEIVSEDEDIFKKAREYLNAGTTLVWAVYSDEKAVYVMQLDDDARLISTTFGTDMTLDGGAVLPGFTLAVRDIFAT